MYKYLLEYLLSVLPSLLTRSGLDEAYEHSVFNVLRDRPITAAPFYIPQAMCEGSYFSTCSSTLIIFPFLKYNHLSVWEVALGMEFKDDRPRKTDILERGLNPSTGRDGWIWFQ